jgi:hypothetical protein
VRNDSSYLAGTNTMSSVAPCLGGAGFGGGAVPVRTTSCDTTVSGVSVTAVAEMFIPSLRPQASVSWPSTLNFWPLGMLKDWFVPSSKVRMTEFGGLTRQTLPVTVFTFSVWCS